MAGGQGRVGPGGRLVEEGAAVDGQHVCLEVALLVGGVRAVRAGVNRAGVDGGVLLQVVLSVRSVEHPAALCAGGSAL